MPKVQYDVFTSQVFEQSLEILHKPAFSLFMRTAFLTELIFTNDLQRVCENEKPAEMISFASSALSVLDNAELSITETENSWVIHMDVT